MSIIIPSNVEFSPSQGRLYGSHKPDELSRIVGSACGVHRSGGSTEKDDLVLLSILCFGLRWP